MRSRKGDLSKMGEQANIHRNLPPNVEMVLYANDKPRIRKDMELPVFTLAGEFLVSSGFPDRWKNHVPFPSHFYLFLFPKASNGTNILSKRPVVFFCGRFSENAWGSFEKKTIGRERHNLSWHLERPILPIVTCSTCV
mmetsp:Transcript_6208/g.7082  ORF Transcript_6208/g.7082 Transcript_6208/m.7082 type:complete len:138 (+) Transcript_6208:365-778(+)